MQLREMVKFNPRPGAAHLCGIEVGSRAAYPLAHPIGHLEVGPLAAFRPPGLF